MCDLLNATPVWDEPTPTDLGAAVETHAITHSVIGSDWANAIRARACRLQDAVLLELTNRMGAMLAQPQAAGPSFREDFIALFEQAWRHAYPLARTVLEQRCKFAGISHNYTLGFFDLGMIRVIEDDAATDTTLRSFVRQMRNKRRWSGATAAVAR